MAYAEWVRDALGVGPRPQPHPGKLQDVYSIRCAPHVVGVLIDAHRHAEDVVAVELNGAGDNPLVCPQTGDMLHGGNFYGGHVAYVADALKAQVASSAEVLERQLVVLCHGGEVAGIPENLVLTRGPGRETQHGFKALEITASALVAEALKLGMPASAFSRSTEGHNQDKVPMATLAARELRRSLELAEYVLVIALLAAAQATDTLGKSEALPPRLAETYRWVRSVCAALMTDARSDQALELLVAAYRSTLVEFV